MLSKLATVNVNVNGEDGAVGKGVSDGDRDAVIGDITDGVNEVGDSVAKNNLDVEFPWSKCMMKCGSPKVEGEVILLPCLHVICSDECVKTLESEVATETETSIKFACKRCGLGFLPNDLTRKVNVAVDFPKKEVIQVPDLICANCVHDYIATAYCPECPSLLCDNCSNLHNQFRVTKNHNLINDVKEQRAQQLRQWEENLMNCKTHEGMKLTHTCLACVKKICKLCLTDHQLHGDDKVVEIEERLQTLTSNISSAKAIKGKCDKVIEEILNKHAEVSSSWENITGEISDHFVILLSALIKAREARYQEAQTIYKKQILQLKLKLKYVQQVRSSAVTFVETAEIVKNKDMDDRAASNLLRHSEEFLSWLNDAKTELDSNFDRFVEKGCHFNVEALDSTKNLVLNSLEKYCKISYSPQPCIPEVAVKTAGSPTKVAKSQRRMPAKNSSKEDKGTQFKVGEPDPEANEQAPSKNAVNNPESTSVSELSKSSLETAAETEKTNVTTVARDIFKKPILPAVGRRTKSTLRRTKTDRGVHSRMDSSNTNVETRLDDSESTTSTTKDTDNGKLDEVVTTNLTPGSSLRPQRNRKKREYPGFISSEVYSFAMYDTASTSKKATLSKGTDNSPKPKLTSLGQKLKKELPEVVDGNNDGEGDMDISDHESSNEPEAGPSNRSLRSRQDLVPEVEIESRPKEKKIGKRGRKSKGWNKSELKDIDAKFLELPEAPESSLEYPTIELDYPLQGRVQMKISNTDHNEDYCCMCLDGGEMIVCCDYCPKIFHITCHIPKLSAVPPGDKNKWGCNYHSTKNAILAAIAEYPNNSGSEDDPLVEGNPRHFLWACKFLMECYKITEIPTMRWIFPTDYARMIGKIPYHMMYIKERLCSSDPEPFYGVEEFLLAFKQMFIQGFLYYKLTSDTCDTYIHAKNCFRKFLELVEDYYPNHKGLFHKVLAYNNQ